MELINNVGKTLRDDLMKQMQSGSRLSIAASCFSIYAFQELKEALKDTKELRFIFTSPTFTTEKTPKQLRSKIGCISKISKIIWCFIRFALSLQKNRNER